MHLRFRPLLTLALAGAALAAGAALLVGIIGMAIRRFIIRPKNLTTRESTLLHPKARFGIQRDSAIVASFIFIHNTARLLGESFYVAESGTPDQWQPVISTVARLWAGVDANTLLAGDKRLNVGRKGGFQSDDNEGYTAGWDHDVIRQTNIPPLPDYSSNNSADHGGGRFGSSHPSGFQALLGDGSVRSIAYTISQSTFSRAGHRGDGQTLNSDWN